MNQNQTQGKWQQLRGASKTLWGKITDNDFKKADGNIDKIYGLIQERYGDSKEVIQEKLEGLQKKELQKTGQGGTGPMEEQLALWGEKLDELIARASKAGASVKEDYHKSLRELSVKYGTVRTRVSEYKSSGAGKWDNFKADLEVAWLDLESAFKKLAS